MSLYSDTPSIIPDNEKPTTYNNFWRSQLTINQNGKIITIQKAYELEYQQNQKLHHQMRKLAFDAIPSDKYILFVNSTSRGIVGSPEFDFIDKDRQEYLFKIETGSSEINKQEFLDRNISYCLGLPYGDNRLRFFHAFSDDTNTIDWSLCVGVILSGGEINVHETDKAHEAALQNILSIIKQSQHLPRLGICLGAQALAYSLGYKVTWVTDSNGEKKFTSGIEKITQTPESILSGVGDLYVAENHAQGIEKTTSTNKDVSVMAESNLGYIEMFQSDKSLGVQFHPEVSLARIDIGKSMRGKHTASDLEEIFKHDLSTVREKVFSYFLNQIKLDTTD